MLDSVLLFLGAQEIILIVLALLLLFGGRKIPELMRGMGRGIREFKEGQKEVPREELKEEKQEAARNWRQQYPDIVRDFMSVIMAGIKSFCFYTVLYFLISYNK